MTNRSRSKIVLALAVIAMATVTGSAHAAVIYISDISLTPDGTAATQELRTDIATPNGGNVLPSGTLTHDVYTVTTYTFGAGSDAHFTSRFNATGTQPRLGVEVQDTGLIQFVSSGDTTRTSVNLAQDMAGQTLTLIIKQNYDPTNNVTYGKANAADDTLMNVWVNPDGSSTEGSGLSAGDMSTIWNSATYGFYTHTIANQSTPGTAGDSLITNTVILTGDDATFANAYALVPEPATMGLLAIGGLALLRRRRK